MKFTLTIDLADAAMRNGADVARALREAAQRIEQTTPGEILTPEAPRNIRDVNGNVVGAWAFDEEGA